MNSIGERLKAHWRSQGIALARASIESQIRDFESRYDVRLPLDFRDYFLCVNGMETYWPNAQDQQGYSFWPLERIKAVPEEAGNHQYGDRWSRVPGAKSLFIFADYLDWSWAYAIRLGKDSLEKTSVFIIAKKETPIEVAASFSDFVELYLVDSPTIYGADR